MTTRLNPGELARFMRRVQVDPETRCWRWLGPKTPNGYPKHTRGPGYRERAAHRIYYEHVHGTIGDGLQLDHVAELCASRPDCVNDAHMEPVTPSVNTDRQRHANRAKTVCAHGHPLSGDNVRVDKRGKRVCLSCERAR